MDQSLNFTPDPASTTSPPDTPTPTPHEIAGPIPVPTMNLLAAQEFKKTTPTATPPSNATQSDLNDSIHTPSNTMMDQPMDTIPNLPTVDHPKFMVRVFDQSGKDVAERPAIIVEQLHASIAVIADFVHQEAPPI
ncbi:hypothetical protein EDD22DRAFT_845461 [Suillus occidentalis]|nr:hypothetical protein EDD22DRAFT_845461 [Suillus occidentalis]